MEQDKNEWVDMNGKRIEYGHIIAVRYVWNSYVGVARFDGLNSESKCVQHAFFSPHPYRKSATYQILGHMNKAHKDFNDDVFNWYNDSKLKCPIKITVYDNIESVNQQP